MDFAGSKYERNIPPPILDRKYMRSVDSRIDGSHPSSSSSYEFVGKPILGSIRRPRWSWALSDNLHVGSSSGGTYVLKMTGSFLVGTKVLVPRGIRPT